MTDRDEALHYLLNKLKSEDGWSGSNLAWNEDKLSIIADQFSSFDGVAKVKVLLSFIGMTPRTISQVSWICSYVAEYRLSVEPPIKDTPIKDTIEITSEQRTSFNVPNGDFNYLVAQKWLYLFHPSSVLQWNAPDPPSCSSRRWWVGAALC